MKDRIQKLIRVPASELLAHPDNWRLHPEQQRGALKSMMDKLGFVSAVIARETEDGLQILDGHLRTEIAGDEDVPVLVVDLSNEEASQMLATFDPIGELAKIDDEAFARLVPDLGPLMDSGDLRALIGQIDREMAEAEQKGEAHDHYVPGMDLEPNEHYDFLVVLARTTHEWNVLCDKLGLEPTKRRNRTGVGRGITAARLLDMIGESDD